MVMLIGYGIRKEEFQLVGKEVQQTIISKILEWLLMVLSIRESRKMNHFQMDFIMGQLLDIKE